MQVAEQAYSLLQSRPPANRMREHRNNRAHEEVVNNCGRGRFSAWGTSGYPKGSCRESWRMRENVGRGGRRNNGLIAWQRILGYLASRGTGAPPHMTPGSGTAQYVKWTVGLWLRGRRKRKRRPNTGSGRNKRKRQTRLRLNLG